MFDVITLGSATVDVYAKTDAAVMSLRRAHHLEEVLVYPVGGKILITDLRFSTGGGGTNTAVGFSRLGLRTAYCGALGNDEPGGWIVKELNKERVAFLGVRLRAQTNYSVVLDSVRHDRTILAFRDASDKLTWAHLPVRQLKTRWLYSSSLMETSFATLKKLAAWAHKQQILVAFNPSSYQAKMGLLVLAPLLRTLRVLILNREEAALLVGDHPVPTQLARLHEAGPACVVITDGPRGTYCLGPTGAYHAHPKPVTVVETTGAGDAFGCGFVAGLIWGFDEPKALRLGAANAESVVAHYGAKNVLLTKRQALERIKRERRRVTRV